MRFVVRLGSVLILPLSSLIDCKLGSSHSEGGMSPLLSSKLGSTPRYGLFDKRGIQVQVSNSTQPPSRKGNFVQRF